MIPMPYNGHDSIKFDCVIFHTYVQLIVLNTIDRKSNFTINRKDFISIVDENISRNL